MFLNKPLNRSHIKENGIKRERKKKGGRRSINVGSIEGLSCQSNRDGS